MSNHEASNRPDNMRIMRMPREPDITLAPGIFHRGPMNNELCRACQQIFQGRLAVHLDSIADPTTDYAFAFQVLSLNSQVLHSTLQELEECFCSLCHIFYSQFSSAKRREWEARIGDRSIYWRFGSISGAQVQVTIFMSQKTQEVGPYSLLMKVPDSLCIIQDDDNDWAEECSKMSLVYENAVCTIAAMDSTDSRGGCFGDRDPRYLQPPTVQTYWTNRTNGLFLCVNPQHLWSRGVSKSPLYQRGWVLQEQVLSRRILHFGKRMLFWECRLKCASEAEPDGVMTVELPTPSVSRMVASTEDAYGLWRKLVIQYSQSQLTYERDKLVAISGVAKMIQRLLSKTCTSEVGYHAGLWSPNLASQLLWEIPPNPSPVPTQPQKYRAPSWSWASIDGEVSLPATWDNRWVVVKSVVPKITPLGRDSFQQIASASLDISGYLWKAGSLPQVNRNDRNFICYKDCW
ncbi:hypothetical protein S40288_10365 [Stachybotrys chartarum IBT 40288]|nr:hypothetical protein S40288_10365 [Stachybotrys chartarum IBT 40288]